MLVVMLNLTMDPLTLGSAEHTKSTVSFHSCPSAINSPEELRHPSSHTQKLPVLQHSSGRKIYYIRGWQF